MSVRITPKLLVPLLLAASSTLAGAACVPVVGTARLVPDASCGIVGAADPKVPGTVFTRQECFSTQLNLAGFPVGTGFSGTTAEGAVSLVPGAPATLTPVALPSLDPQQLPRVVQTARSTITLGNGARATKIYTSDVVVLQPVALPNGQQVPKAFTEQIVITGTNKQGAYANVTGYLHLMGTLVGVPAVVAGQICMP